MFKFIHAADIHLDSPLKGLERYEGAPVEEMRRSTRRALENLTDLAIAERVAFVLIAGDLYDGNWNDHGTGLYLNSQMAKLRDAGIGVVLIQGNHDAASQMTKHLNLPDNVHRMWTDRPESFPIEDCGVMVHGQGFATRAVLDNIAAAYPSKEPNYFNIGLLHTCATGREGHERYAPCSIDDLRVKGFNYWALGHIHKREILHNDPPIVFAGNIQGRNVRELGTKGCMLVTVNDGGRVESEFRPLDVMRWAHPRIKAEGATDLDEVLQLIGERLSALSAEAEGRLLAVRIEVEGPCPAHRDLVADQDALLAQVRDRARDAGQGRIWVEKLKLRTSEPRTLDLDDGPIGLFLSRLEDLKRDEAGLLKLASEELTDLKRKLPPELLSDDEDSLKLNDPARLRELLDLAGSLVAQRLFQTGGSL
ncbi:MAG: DNA repair exonuclease [Isosphaeraceae bacterium]